MESPTSPSIFASPFWENRKEILNPGTSSGAKPWVFYTIYAFFVFLFNIFDIANLPKEIADYMTKMGARIPNINFWGGLLLSILATSSILLDHYLRRINEGFALGFTSVLIIVSPIEYGHVLLIPKVLECLPQRIDSESLMLALHFAVEAGSPYFRLANGKSEKLASGLLNPFIAHQIAKGGHSITLEPDLSTDAFRFTKGTVESDL